MYFVQIQTPHGRMQKATFEKQDSGAVFANRELRDAATVRMQAHRTCAASIGSRENTAAVVEVDVSSAPMGPESAPRLSSTSYFRHRAKARPTWLPGFRTKGRTRSCTWKA
jgi:hypothetical protein